MPQDERFRLHVEGVFGISGRRTGVLGPILSGSISIGDLLAVEGREHLAPAACTAIDAGPRVLKTLEDGLSRVGLILAAWTEDDVLEGDVLVAIEPE